MSAHYSDKCKAFLLYGTHFRPTVMEHSDSSNENYQLRNYLGEYGYSTLIIESYKLHTIKEFVMLGTAWSVNLLALVIDRYLHQKILLQ